MAHIVKELLIAFSFQQQQVSRILFLLNIPNMAAIIEKQKNVIQYHNYVREKNCLRKKYVFFSIHYNLYTLSS